MNPKVWRNEQGSLCCPSEVLKKSRSMKRLKRNFFFSADSRMGKRGRVYFIIVV